MRGRRRFEHLVGRCKPPGRLDGGVQAEGAALRLEPGEVGGGLGAVRVSGESAGPSPVTALNPGLNPRGKTSLAGGFRVL